MKRPQVTVSRGEKDSQEAASMTQLIVMGETKGI